MASDVLPAAGDTPACPAPARALELDPATFRAHFNRTPYLIPHNLVGHPLFTLPRLVELARHLPDEYVEYYAGNVPESIDWKLTPRNGLSPEETIRRIEEHCSWMVLKRVEQDPEYDALLNRILDEIEALSAPLDPGMCNRAGAIFISSPGAVTPYHMDKEYNFLLQFRGSKVIHVYDVNDPDVATEEDLEDHLCRTTIDRNLALRETAKPKGKPFDLTTGRVLHIPVLHPHWVQNGPGVSISFSAGFDTDGSIRKAALHRANHRLRAWGLRPTPVGRSPWRDALKFAAYRACDRVRPMWRGRPRGLRPDEPGM